MKEKETEKGRMRVEERGITRKRDGEKGTERAEKTGDKDRQTY